MLAHKFSMLPAFILYKYNLHKHKYKDQNMGFGSYVCLQTVIQGHLLVSCSTLDKFPWFMCLKVAISKMRYAKNNFQTFTKSKIIGYVLT